MTNGGVERTLPANFGICVFWLAHLMPVFVGVGPDCVWKLDHNSEGLSIWSCTVNIDMFKSLVCLIYSYSAVAIIQQAILQST